MKIRIVLLSLLMALLLCGVVMPASASTEPGIVKDLGPVTMPNGLAMHCFEVSIPSDACAVMVTHEAGGVIKTQSFKTMDDFDEATGHLRPADPSTDTSTVRSPSKTIGAAATLSQKSKTYNSRLSYGGTSYNSLYSTLNWQYNGSTVTYATTSASSGWRSPWTHYGSSDQYLGPYPASSVLYRITQFYIVTAPYVNFLQNNITGYGSGSYSSGGSTYGINPDPTGWTYTAWWS